MRPSVTDIVMASGWSRKQLSELLPDETLGPLVHNCDSSTCGHVHCEFEFTQAKFQIIEFDQLRRFPSMAVLDVLLREVQIQDDGGSVHLAVRWQDFGSFTYGDLLTLKSFANLVATCNVQINKEEIMKNATEPSPYGLKSLPPNDQFYDIHWNGQITTRPIDVTHKEGIDVLLALSEAQHITMHQNLDSESLSELANPDGQLSTPTLSWFINLIQNEIPNHLFILIDDNLTTSESRQAHARKLCIHECKPDAWLFFILNRGVNNLINGNSITGGHHWIVVFVSPKGEVLYGDPLLSDNSRTIPPNLKDYLQDYYIQRFRQSILGITNITRHPNFPCQESDTNLCGHICIMIFMLAKQIPILRSILTVGPRLDSLNLTSSPGLYPVYLRRFLQETYIRRQISIDLLVSTVGKKEVVRNCHKFSFPMYKESREFEQHWSPVISKKTTKKASSRLKTNVNNPSPPLTRSASVSTFMGAASSLKPRTIKPPPISSPNKTPTCPMSSSPLSTKSRTPLLELSSKPVSTKSRNPLTSNSTTKKSSKLTIPPNSECVPNVLVDQELPRNTNIASDQQWTPVVSKSTKKLQNKLSLKRPTLCSLNKNETLLKKPPGNLKVTLQPSSRTLPKLSSKSSPVLLDKDLPMENSCSPEQQLTPVVNKTTKEIAKKLTSLRGGDLKNSSPAMTRSGSASGSLFMNETLLKKPPSSQKAPGNPSSGNPPKLPRSSPKSAECGKPISLQSTQELPTISTNHEPPVLRDEECPIENNDTPGQQGTSVVSNNPKKKRNKLTLGQKQNAIHQSPPVTRSASGSSLKKASSHSPNTNAADNISSSKGAPKIREPMSTKSTKLLSGKSTNSMSSECTKDIPSKSTIRPSKVNNKQLCPDTTNDVSSLSSKQASNESSKKVPTISSTASLLPKTCDFSHPRNQTVSNTEVHNVEASSTCTSLIENSLISSNENDPVESTSVLPTFLETITFLYSSKYPNNDSFTWKAIGKKKKVGTWQFYNCTATGCTATKKSRRQMKSNINENQPANIKFKTKQFPFIEVTYMKEHSCIAYSTLETSSTTNLETSALGGAPPVGNIASEVEMKTSDSKFPNSEEVSPSLEVDMSSPLSRDVSSPDKVLLPPAISAKISTSGHMSSPPSIDTKRSTLEDILLPTSNDVETYAVERASPVGNISSEVQMKTCNGVFPNSEVASPSLEVDMSWSLSRDVQGKTIDVLLPPITSSPPLIHVDISLPDKVSSPPAISAKISTSGDESSPPSKDVIKLLTVDVSSPQSAEEDVSSYPPMEVHIPTTVELLSPPSPDIIKPSKEDQLSSHISEPPVKVAEQFPCTLFTPKSSPSPPANESSSPFGCTLPPGVSSPPTGVTSTPTGITSTPGNADVLFAPSIDIDLTSPTSIDVDALSPQSTEEYVSSPPIEVHIPTTVELFSPPSPDVPKPSKVDKFSSHISEPPVKVAEQSSCTLSTRKSSTSPPVTVSSSPVGFTLPPGVSSPPTGVTSTPRGITSTPEPPVKLAEQSSCTLSTPKSSPSPPANESSSPFGCTLPPGVSTPPTGVTSTPTGITSTPIGFAVPPVYSTSTPNEEVMSWLQSKSKFSVSKSSMSRSPPLDPQEIATSPSLRRKAKSVASTSISISEDEFDIDVHFKYGKKERSYKLVQLDHYPDNIKVRVSQDSAVILSHKDAKSANRINFDIYSWRPQSGGRRGSIYVGTQYCQVKGCKATKKKWTCFGNCDFNDSFCCTYSKPETTSCILLYTFRHNHAVNELGSVSVLNLKNNKGHSYQDGQTVVEDREDLKTSQSIHNSRSEHSSSISAASIHSTTYKDVSQNSQSVHNSHSEDGSSISAASIHSDTFKEVSQNSQSEEGSYTSENSMRDTKVSNKEYSDTDSATLKTKLELFSPSSTILETNSGNISPLNMCKTIHIIEKGDFYKYASYICRDGFTYKSSPTNIKLPLLFDDQQNALVQTCCGRRYCLNTECDVYKRFTSLYSEPNKDNKETKCKFCGSSNSGNQFSLKENKCTGKRYIISSPNSRYVVVNYMENHTCGQPDAVLDEEVLSRLKKKFEDNSQMSSGQAFRQLVEETVQRIQLTDNAEVKQKQKENLTRLIETCLHDSVPKNVKATVKNSKNQFGIGLEAVQRIKLIFDEGYEEFNINLTIVLDAYVCGTCKYTSYIEEEHETLETHCQSCNVPMQNVGPTVLLTSKQQMETAKQMTDGVFKTSTCFSHHQPGRVNDWNTLTASVYDFNLQSMAALFTVHGKFEDQYSVYFAFLLFKVTMQKHYNDVSVVFCPFGFTIDNAGGLICGIKMMFGNIHIRTCKFHYIFCAYQICGNAIGSEKDQISFLRSVWALLEAPTPTQYYTIYESFKTWIKQTPSRSSKLEPWLEFWHNSRTKWSEAFVNLNLTDVNLQETLHTAYSKKNNMKNLILPQAIDFEIGDCLLYKARLLALTLGGYIGTGPSKTILDEREAMCQMERVRRTCFKQSELAEVLNYLGISNKANQQIHSESDSSSNHMQSPLIGGEQDRRKAFEKYTPDPQSSHTYKAKTPSKVTMLKGSDRKKPGRPPGALSKKRISRFNRMEDSDDDFQPTNESNKKKSGPSTGASFKNRISRPNIIEDSDDEFQPTTNESNKNKSGPSTGLSFKDTISRPNRIEDSEDDLQETPKVTNIEKIKRKTFKDRTSRPNTISDSDDDFQPTTKESNKKKIVPSTGVSFKDRIEDSDDDLQETTNIEKSKRKTRFNRAFSEMLSEEELPDIDKYSVIGKNVIVEGSPNLSFIQQSMNTPELDDMTIPITDSYVAADESLENEVVFRDAKRIPRQRSAPTKHYVDMKKRCYEEQDLLIFTVKQSDDIFKFEFLKQNKDNRRSPRKSFHEPITYMVTFEQNEVTCTCDHFRNLKFGLTGKGMRTKLDVCKHIVCVVLRAPVHSHNIYKGNNTYNANEWDALKLFLKDVDPERRFTEEVFKKVTKAAAMLQRFPSPVPLPIQDDRKFDSKDDALEASPRTTWFAEIYNRKNTKGRYPKCKTCSFKFSVGSLTIRTDVCEAYENPHSQKYRQDPQAYRFCPKLSCVTGLNNYYREKSSFRDADGISLAHVTEEYKQQLQKIFEKSNIFLFN